MQKPLIIAGPTASGKSAYAIGIAQQQGGVIINADSMQVYADLPVLTAHPSIDDQASIPHKLYGVLSGGELCSAARWVDMALETITWCQSQGLRPILVGGTGMYLSALTKGLAEVPDIDPAVRENCRQLYEDLGADGFYCHLIDIDPLMAEHLNPYDRQRQIRALEVKLSTGKSLLEWQNKTSPTTDISFDMIVIERSREELHARASQRFDQMLDQDALGEVQTLCAKGYGEDLPVMRALGVRELSAYSRGEIALDKARELSVIATRQYIKRQDTYFRNQFPNAERVRLT
jgi:tRNA dimethylallyltransferase